MRKGVEFCGAETLIILGAGRETGKQGRKLFREIAPAAGHAEKQLTPVIAAWLAVSRRHEFGPSGVRRELRARTHLLRLHRGLPTCKMRVSEPLSINQNPRARDLSDSERASPPRGVQTLPRIVRISKHAPIRGTFTQIPLSKPSNNARCTCRSDNLITISRELDINFSTCAIE